MKSFKLKALSAMFSQLLYLYCKASVKLGDLTQAFLTKQIRVQVGVRVRTMIVFVVRKKGLVFGDQDRDQDSFTFLGTESGLFAGIRQILMNTS